MTKEDHAIQGSPVRFASFGPTEWLFVHGGILIAWALVLASTVLLPPVWGALWAVALGILVILAIPIIEEFMFRGWLLRALEHRLSPITAVTISAALFALVLGRRAAREKSAPRGL